MNAPVETTAEAAALATDFRFAFLCSTAGHYRLVRDGHESLNDGFDAVVRLHDAWFALDPECTVCGLAPCQSPTFCNSCRKADYRRGRR